MRLKCKILHDFDIYTVSIRVGKMNSDILKIEDTMYNTLEKTSISLLDNSLLEMCNNTTNFGKLLATVNLQISLELLMKCYAIKLYGFEEVLTPKMKNLRINEPENYKSLLVENNIKTLGYNELVKLFERKRDVFAPIIRNGECPCFGVDFSYLEGEFDKFQAIRNKFVHIGAALSENDSKWIKIEYFSLVTIFISLLFREIDNLKDNSGYQPRIHDINSFYDEISNLYATPLDIFRRHLKGSTIDALISNEAFFTNLLDYASDAYSDSHCYTCYDCGKMSLFLNIFEGFSKCICCGSIFSAAYANCVLCGHSDSVIYDELNMDVNNYVMPGYCCNCKKHTKVYMCPTCGNVYPYKKSISNYYSDCCERNFHDRFISIIDFDFI